MLLAESPPEAPLTCTLGRATLRRSWWMAWLLQASRARCSRGGRRACSAAGLGSSASRCRARRGAPRWKKGVVGARRRACQAPASARSGGDGKQKLSINLSLKVSPPPPTDNQARRGRPLRGHKVVAACQLAMCTHVAHVGARASRASDSLQLTCPPHGATWAKAGRGRRRTSQTRT